MRNNFLTDKLANQKNLIGIHRLDEQRTNFIEGFLWVYRKWIGGSAAIYETIDNVSNRKDGVRTACAFLRQTDYHEN